MQGLLKEGNTRLFCASHWPRCRATAAAGNSSRAKSPFIFSILSQSVNSLFCVDEQGVCSSAACCPVTHSDFQGQSGAHVQTRHAEGPYRGIPIKALQSHEDQGVWLGLEAERLKKRIIGTFCCRGWWFLYRRENAVLQNLGQQALAIISTFISAGNVRLSSHATLHAPFNIDPVEICCFQSAGSLMTWGGSIYFASSLKGDTSLITVTLQKHFFKFF